eukprot:CAMPEP_0172177714 /NCGR_PEP_ID=MMETSP1050-20130122/15609_1 /TAXON_ID=233186 /ORGANISM="Cryptomonas curvata, Strain CCAP979/52" /LENGTH=109 /DNA_ID=CAMNT_0012850303 /DNA_START=1 /DNA_END=330 /DNA_ORIENTATION=+
MAHHTTSFDDLTGVSLEYKYTPQQLDRSCDDISRPDFFAFLEEEDVFIDSLISKTRTKCDLSTRNECAQIQTVHRDHTKKPNPRLLYNSCIGRITDLESRNPWTKTHLD